MKRTLIHLLLAVTYASSASLGTGRSVILLERKDFIGVWQGYSDYVWDFARLEFDADGGGFLAVSELPKTPVDAYQVRWSYEDGHASITVMPLEPRTPKITIHDVQQTTNAVELELRGAGYKRKMHLFNGADLDSRITDTTTRIQEARATIKPAK